MKVNAISIDNESSLANNGTKTFVSGSDVLKQETYLKSNTNAQPINVHVTFLKNIIMIEIQQNTCYKEGLCL